LDGGVYRVSDGELDYGFGWEYGLVDCERLVLPDGPPARRAATSWRVYLVWAGL
jgi:hypothetical protein